MRFFLRAVTLASAILLSLSMLAVNIAFELSGSVPDVEGCGFVAGSLAVLLLLYPVLAALVASRSTHLILSRQVYDPSVAGRLGGRIGLWGSSFYFAAGILGVLSAPHTTGVPPLAWLSAVVFSLCAMGGGRFGALLTLHRAMNERVVAAGESGR